MTLKIGIRYFVSFFYENCINLLINQEFNLPYFFYTIQWYFSFILYSGIFRNYLHRYFLLNFLFSFDYTVSYYRKLLVVKFELIFQKS